MVEALFMSHAIKISSAWVAQSIKHSTLDFGSGHDLMVHEIEPHKPRSRVCADSREPAWDSLSLSWDSPLFLPLPLVLSFSLKINKNKHVF